MKSLISTLLIFALIFSFCAYAEEQTEYSVELISYGGESDFQAIVDIKNVADIGMYEAKKVLDNMPSIVQYGLTLEEAEDIKSMLGFKGFKAEIKESSDLDVIGEGEGAILESPDGKYAVVYTGTSQSKDDTIELIRIQTGATLKEAKEIVEKAPSTLRNDLPIEKAKKLKDWFEKNAIETKIIPNSKRSKD